MSRSLHRYGLQFDRNPRTVACPDCLAAPGFRCHFLNGKEMMSCHSSRKAIAAQDKVEINDIRLLSRNIAPMREIVQSGVGLA